MDVSKINSAVLRNLLKLSDKRESLLSELSKIEKQLSSFSKGGTVTATKGKKRGPKKKTAVKPAKAGKKVRRGRKGGLKKKILAALSSAGSAGVTVKDLASKLKVPPQNVHVWFSSTGKGVAGISKVSPGRYKIS